MSESSLWQEVERARERAKSVPPWARPVFVTKVAPTLRELLEEQKARAEAAEQSDREAHEALLHTAEQLKAAERKVARVEALHAPAAGCCNEGCPGDFPCATVRALADEEGK